MEILTGVEGIGHLLSDRLLAIPDYQREYSWDIDEVTELWSDLNDAISQDDSDYFLGSIVTTGSDKTTRQQVIDGQQRLATVSLMYAVMRDIFARRADERAAEIERKMLGERDIMTRARQPRLVLNAQDNDVFRQLTLESEENRRIEVRQDSHQRLLDSFTFFKEKFETLIAGLGVDAWQQPLLRWYNFVFKRAQVIEVGVADESRAFVIFETLNDRGLNLSTSDLLKNHLFGTAGERIEEAKLSWTRAMAPFAPVTSSFDKDIFLKHFWASKRGVARVKALYSQIKPEIDDPEAAVGFAREMAECGPLWAAMYDRDADLWNGYSASALGALDTLRNLNVEQCRPLMLAALRRLPPPEVERLLALLVGWSVRWFVVGGGSAGVTERLYATAAQKVTDGEVSDVDAITVLFTKAVPNDLAFEQAFRVMIVRSGWQARYYLTALERAVRDEPEPELVPNQNVDEVNLEHVLPRNPIASEWPYFDLDELQNMRLMLGNMVLLRKADNTRLGNRPFIEKKPVLAASDLVWTKGAGDSPAWRPNVISKRQADMARLARSIWIRT